MASPVGAPPLAVQPSASLSSSSSSPAATLPGSSIAPVTATTTSTNSADDAAVFQLQRDKCNRMKAKALDSQLHYH